MFYVGMKTFINLKSLLQFLNYYTSKQISLHPEKLYDIIYYHSMFKRTVRHLTT